MMLSIERNSKEVKGKLKGRYFVPLMASLLLLTLLMSCSDHESLDQGGDNADLPTVTAKYSFALPKRIVGKRSTTRMGGDVVQEGATSDNFRGIDDIHLFCFDQMPTSTSQKLGSVIELNSAKSNELDETAETDYSVTQEIRIPVGTSHFAFYARAKDAPKTHEQRMKYGVIETVGLGKSNYSGNSNIRFRPVPICTSTEPLGGSVKGQALLSLLNDLVNTTVDVASPNNRWTTVGNLYMNEAFQQLTAMTTLSSYNVQVMLGYINKAVNQEAVDDQGKELAAAITAKIASCSVYPPPSDKDTLTLKDDYQGFPDDIHLPAGAARIVWNAAANRFDLPVTQDYGKGLNISSLNDYVYPMNLQYQIFSDIVASDSLIDLEDVAEAIAPQPTGQVDPETGDSITVSQAQSWNELLDSAYTDATKEVAPTTQSVAMVQQVEYAVGRLALRSRISMGNIYDARGKLVDVSKGFTLKGYIIGGQREVDYDFQPVEASREYAIYDTDLAGGEQLVKRGYGATGWTEENYILGLGTARGKDIYMALELVNNGDSFQGADGLIVHGATFYLVASMVPSQGENYQVGLLDQIFSKDTATKVDLTVMNGWPDKDGDGVPDPDNDEHGNPKPINGLATATYGMPDMQISHPVVGLSVDLSWGEGLYFEDIEL